MEASRGAAHRVLPRGMAIVGGAGLDAAHAGMPVVNIAAMRMAVVPIFPTLVGSGRTRGLLRAGTVATKPGWLLWETTTTTTVVTTGTAVVGAAAVASVVVIVECVLLLCRGIDVGQVLLANSHA